MTSKKAKKDNGLATTKTAKKVGRPSKFTEDTVAKLEEVFKIGVTIQVACTQVGIHKSNYFRNYKNDQEFATKMDAARNYARLAAGNVVMDSIVKRRNTQDAKWWLEKKHSEEFRSGTSPLVNVQGEKVLVMPSDLMGRYAINQTTPRPKGGGEKSGEV